MSGIQSFTLGHSDDADRVIRLSGLHWQYLIPPWDTTSDRGNQRLVANSSSLSLS